MARAAVFIDGQDLFRSDHLWLGAFLRCRGHALVTVEGDGERGAFVFKKSGRLLADVADFAGDGEVPARDYAARILELRRRLDTWRKERKGERNGQSTTGRR